MHEHEKCRKKNFDVKRVCTKFRHSESFQSSPALQTSDWKDPKRVLQSKIVAFLPHQEVSCKTWNHKTLTHEQTASTATRSILS